jgi:hypothetical protein
MDTSSNPSPYPDGNGHFMHPLWEGDFRPDNVVSHLFNRRVLQYDVLGPYASKYDVEKEFELWQQENLGTVPYEVKIFHTPQ